MAKGGSHLRALAAAALGCCFLLQVLAVKAEYVSLLAAAKSVQVKTRLSDRFQIGRDLDTFGPLAFLGGLELISADRNVGGLSGLLSLDSGNQILAVTDNGLWFAAEIKQSPDGTPLDVTNARYTPMLNREGKSLRAAWQHDTEAIAIDGDSLLVTAERANDIFRFPWPLATGKERMIEELPVSSEIKALRSSKGLEALAMPPTGSRLQGTALAIAERGPSGSDSIPAFLLKEGQQETLSVARSDRYDVTDATFLPTGDLLLLERRFNLRDLVGMRIRLIQDADILPGARLEGQVLLEADYGYQIDNMEGIAIHEGPDGATILTLLSDNNRSLLQRTLLLRFKMDAL
ncbi:MAG: esterase-like activity of phytase family protein [Roseibium sp.]|uniref:esterase-like activity of phytase family protein n=1 Tax=Roseibium sp. TaxID=1936156 RepID=UPI003297AA49